MCVALGIVGGVIQFPWSREQRWEDVQVAAGNNGRKEVLVEGERHHVSCSTEEQRGADPKAPGRALLCPGTEDIRCNSP